MKIKENFNGAFVISIDFELHWGMRDMYSSSHPYHKNFLGARFAIPQILELFEEYHVAATWAVVGFLFASSRSELEKFSPKIRPQYVNSSLDPYQESLGLDEQEDLLHYAPSLIKLIASKKEQEIATHTFSHYYCLEPGQNREAFMADLNSAVAIAKKYGINLHSIVFPRNQVNPDYEDILVESGIFCYRGNEQSWMYNSPGRGRLIGLCKRVSRIIDSYISLSGSHLIDWDQVYQPNGLCNVPSSRFLRPFSPRLKSFEKIRLRRITNSIREAAKSHKIFHLWWHPHNFGANTEQNLQFLRCILEEFKNCQEQYGMRSLSMVEVAEAASYDNGQQNCGGEM